MVRSQAMPEVTISRLARGAGVGVETVRYYQRRGLMREPPRPPGAGANGGVRRYGEDDARRLRFIRAAQGAGFTLEDIRELITLDTGSDRRRVRRIASARIAELDDRIAALQTARKALSRLAEACAEGGAGPCPILTAFE